ncbi:uncharacterized protein [Ptychodera flava]|uniref:uncharacterized protein isoform X2 n=1 Tax=Ptychodera flava TaxID=63121 RepID=UPI00396A5484
MSEASDTEAKNVDETSEKDVPDEGEGVVPSDDNDVDQDEQIDSVSVELNRRDGADVGDIPEPSTNPIERSSSSLTIENVKALEEATERGDGHWSPSKFSSGRGSRQKQEAGSRSSSPQLPPVKTGRASADVVSEVSSLTQNEHGNATSHPGSQLPGSEPLPPIGQSGGESDNFDSTTIRSLDTESGVTGETASSMKVSSSHPRIMQFKRELPPGYDFEREASNLSNVSAKSNKTTDSSSSKKTVTFSENTERPSSKASSKKEPLSKTVATREVKKIRTADGAEMVAVSIGTETEWSWLDSVRLAGKIDELEAMKPTNKDTMEKQEKKQRPPEGSGLSKKKRRKKHPSLSSSQISDSDGESTLSGTTGVSSKSAKGSSTKYSARKKEFFDFGEDGIPPLELSSESDSSDFEEDQGKEREDDLSDLMPGVGPPTILQYQRESEQPQIEYKEPDAKPGGGLPEGGIWSGTCEFCQQPIKPFPTLEMQQRYPSSQLYCCEDYHQFAEYTIRNGPEGSYPVDEKIDIAPHPPYGSKQARRAAKERAAQRMREREMARQRAAGANQANFYASGTSSKRDKLSEFKKPKGVGESSPMISNSDRSPVISQSARSQVIGESSRSQAISQSSRSQAINQSSRSLRRKDTGQEETKKPASVRERARLVDGLSTSRSKRGSTTASLSTDKGLNRLSNKWDISLEVTEAAMSRLQQKLIAKVDIFPEPSSLFARQMKTINYAYSSQKCRDEGWTLRPPSPLFEEIAAPEVFEPEPLPPAFSVRSKKQERPLVQKYYEDGRKFLTIFADGTGNVFYPSGNLAILISSVKRGQYNYVVLDDLSSNAAMLATFDPHGKGTCYYNNGIIRLNMTEYGGILSDSSGAKKKKWNWRDLLTHVHAPPFQPICIALNKYIAVRVQSQEHIYLSINCDMRSARFNTGVKLKLVKPSNLPEPEIEDDDLFIRDMRAYVQSILDKVQNLMKFSKSPKLEQIQPPMHLAQQIQRNARLKQKSLQQKGKNKDSPMVSVN